MKVEHEEMRSFNERTELNTEQLNCQLKCQSFSDRFALKITLKNRLPPLFTMRKIFILLVILPLVTLAMYPGNPRRYNEGARYEHRYNRKYGRPSRPEYRKRYQKYDDYPPWHHHENGEKEPVVTKEPTIPTNSGTL